MTTQRGFLDKLISLLDAIGIPYMVAGSLGSSFYGRPRATQDVDVVIAPSAGQMEDLIARLDGLGCYVSADAAREALKQRTMFNVIDTAAGWKADLIIRKDRSFSVEEFGRRRQVEASGRTLWIVSPEDTILSKLEWAKGRQSELQQTDAKGVMLSLRGELDVAYLKRWAKELGVEQALSHLLDEVGLGSEGSW